MGYTLSSLRTVCLHCISAAALTRRMISHSSRRRLRDLRWISSQVFRLCLGIDLFQDPHGTSERRAACPSNPKLPLVHFNCVGWPQYFPASCVWQPGTIGMHCATSSYSGAFAQIAELFWYGQAANNIYSALALSDPFYFVLMCFNFFGS